YWKDEPPPFTLGHEIAGRGEAVGTGVTQFRDGDAVEVNPSWGSCVRCRMCRSGEENHCLHQKAIRAPGVGYDGGHAPVWPWSLVLRCLKEEMRNADEIHLSHLD